MYPLLDVKRDMYVLPNLIRYLSTYKFMSHIALIVQAHASLVLLLCLLSLSLSQREIRHINISMNTKDVEVTLIKKEVVTVQLPKNEDHWLPLSNLDLCILHPLDFSIFLCYKKPTYKDNGNSMAMVEVLKKALKEALVPYYFLAGEKVPDSMGEHKLHCNNRGVVFTEAFANIELQKLNLNEPDETIGCKLVPKKKNGVLAVQVCQNFRKLSCYYFKNTLLNKYEKS